MFVATAFTADDPGDAVLTKLVIPPSPGLNGDDATPLEVVFVQKLREAKKARTKQWIEAVL